MSAIECPNCGEWIEVETVFEFNYLADFDEVSAECDGHCEGCGAVVQWSKVFVFSHDHDVVVMGYRTENEGEQNGHACTSNVTNHYSRKLEGFFPSFISWVVSYN